MENHVMEHYGIPMISVQAFPWYDASISYILSFFLTVQQRLEANNCENTLFVSLEPQMILLNSVNPYLY